MGFYSDIHEIMLKLMMIDKRSKEGRHLKNEIKRRWTNATDDDLIDWAWHATASELKDYEPETFNTLFEMFFEKSLKEAKATRFRHQAKAEIKSFIEGEED